MASRGKKKTTMAKLAREHRLRERRIDKQARKDARKLESPVDPLPDGELPDPELSDPELSDPELSVPELSVPKET